MKFTKYKKDWLIIDESNYQSLQEKNKIHLIKLDFKTPTNDKVKTVIRNFPNTNRYIISDNIRFYNSVLKGVKKYYVENQKESSLISFIRKNNKILLNWENLSERDKMFIYYNIADLLSNIEVIRFTDTEQLSDSFLEQLNKWDGNVLVQ